ncbi:hypothetical protein IO99_09005 [Clostridium sulfidigenes]|uniref:Uncharacterized protein n=1 Tax=Clostridium sulfidigenes TaxID=318464 RepID=A0A084JCC5_9CLOT|nr:DUF5685 family protein [Clostridium sulfidigenes]KEZ86609.1 hypothetical protein IO99_09005 [Clostridium sulfidigenes]HCO74435.1 hypothetical protein [Clostridium sp.]
MFGYVTPYKMELKIKDYEMFKAYYCGLCISIKNNFSNLCRMTLNYDMTFLGILLDSLEYSKHKYVVTKCIAHPMKKRPKVIDNRALDYAGFCNVSLVYYKLLDDYNDDNSLSKKFISMYIKKFINKSKEDLSPILVNIEENIKKLSFLEKSGEIISIDELSDPFASLTAFIVSYYYKDENFYNELYNLGYNLGRWIYIIDAFDDLKEDMEKHKFNAINKAFNTENLSYEELIINQGNRIEFNLLMSANTTVEALDKLPINKNKDLLFNILQLGLMNKIETIKSRSDKKHE